MLILDPIGDLITRIRNASMRRKESVTVPYSTMRMNVLTVLKDEGYILDFEEVNASPSNLIRIQLKYSEGESVITSMKRVSKPSRRVYSSVKKLQSIYNGLGISVLSTPKGVMSDDMARKQNVGGEILFTVF